MTLKQMKEQRSALAQEMKSILDLCETETRNLSEDENTKFNELNMKIADLDSQIEAKKNEQRSIEPSEIVDNKIIEKRGNVEMEKTFEMETRAIADYIRKNDSEELRAMNRTSGGALVPTHLLNEVISKLSETAPLFAQTRLFTPEGGKLDVLREDNIGAGAWIGEGQSANPSDFKVQKVTLQGNRATATIQLSQSLINDSGINISEYALNILIRRLSAVLNESVLVGQGAAHEQPEGILLAPEECHVKSASKSAIDIDDLIELYNSMHPEYLSNACFVFGRKEFNKIAKLKDANGAYYLQKDLVTKGVAYRLMGLPVYISDKMAANTGAGEEKLAVLVNLNAAYGTLISKGIELKTINNDSTTALNGTTLMVMDVFVDGKLINNEAVKILVTPQ